MPYTAHTVSRYRLEPEHKAVWFCSLKRRDATHPGQMCIHIGASIRHKRTQGCFFHFAYISRLKFKVLMSCLTFFPFSSPQLPSPSEFLKLQPLHILFSCSLGFLSSASTLLFAPLLPPSHLNYIASPQHSSLPLPHLAYHFVLPSTFLLFHSHSWLPLFLRRLIT